MTERERDIEFLRYMRNIAESLEKLTKFTEKVDKSFEMCGHGNVVILCPYNHFDDPYQNKYRE